MEEGLSKSIPFSAINIEKAHLNFADMMPYAVFIALNKRIIYCNESGARLIGVSDPIEMKGRCIEEFIHPRFLNDYESATSIPFEKGKISSSIETKIINLAGITRDVEIGSSPFSYNGDYGVYLIIRDITNSNKIKKSLKESEEKYRTLVEMLPDAICLRSKNRLIYANMAAVKNFGCNKPEEVVGKDITDFITLYPSNKSGIQEYENELRQKGYIPFREDCYIKKINGEILLRETAVKLIPNGEEPVYLVISRDISERKQTEELKKRMEKNTKELFEVVEYDKMRTEFFSNISHEFRTPLNVMLSALQLSSIVIKDSPASECRDKIGNYMKLMKQNCYRLVRLVNNLIDISKIDTGYFNISPEECNIVSTIEDITLSVKEFIENKGITLTFDTDSEEIIMMYDSDIIKRIMLNLLSNALKFTNSPGYITVNVWNKENKIFISVKDTGIGVPKGKEILIFDRFQKVDKSLSRDHEGSGIGLSLVKSLVEMHGGSIRLNSSYCEGSEFIMELPKNNYLDEKIINEKSHVHQSNLERINIEFSDIYF
ncbi:MAG: domain S-box protein [Clostridiales bacterium]|jgi:PAS domain S-box-containing protein|nr:domain S-box protein [Clostridiales bacterium]